MIEDVNQVSSVKFAEYFFFIIVFLILIIIDIAIVSNRVYFFLLFYFQQISSLFLFIFSGQDRKDWFEPEDVERIGAEGLRYPPREPGV